ncbi:MAG: hypothetical protein ACOYON_08995 [Fimbriimonas sp.]
MLLPVVLLGCKGPDQSWMPMAVGKSWTYVVVIRGEFSRIDVRVERSIAVGDASGFELRSSLGTSRFAWFGGKLITTELAGARVSPPLPILDPSAKEVSWTGYVNTLGKAEKAEATIKIEKTKLSDGLRTKDTLHSTVKVSLPGREVTLDTWFRSGVGIVRQEQRTGSDLDFSLNLKTNR